MAFPARFSGPDSWHAGNPTVAVDTNPGEHFDLRSFWRTRSRNFALPGSMACAMLRMVARHRLIAVGRRFLPLPRQATATARRYLYTISSKRLRRLFIESFCHFAQPLSTMIAMRIIRKRIRGVAYRHNWHQYRRPNASECFGILHRLELEPPGTAILE